jgi:hypothetical protein
MSINTNLRGRLRNTPLPRSHGLLPLFEAVVNSIHAIDEVRRVDGRITVEIVREITLPLDDQRSPRRGVAPTENILGFHIADNGCGFNDENMASFETLDSEYKAKLGCRGVGRLLWLKAFSFVKVDSTYIEGSTFARRTFSFSADKGVYGIQIETPLLSELATTVVLDGFNQEYRDRSHKTARAIASSLLEHCLWYFVREGGAPDIFVKDGPEVINLEDLFKEYMYSSTSKQKIALSGISFELTHIKLRASAGKQHFIAWCAAGRVVEEEAITGKLPGLYGKLVEDQDEFVYACYVSSEYLDERVRPERIGFDLPSDLLSPVNSDAIRAAVLEAAGKELHPYLVEAQAASKERVEKFVAERAPRYRPIMFRISEAKLSVDPAISDRDLDLVLHKKLSELETELLQEGHQIAALANHEDPMQYRERLRSYLEMASDLKKSDLADYVFHRKVILDILEQAIKRGEDGKYAREELIHELIMPLRRDSTEISLDSCNLWLIDERLAFHDYLASDKPITSMPITGSTSPKEPDICALNVYDQPLLVADGKRLPLASIVIVELKRPMRNDASAGEDKDPIEQALGYLDRIRSGGATTSAGRPIPKSEDIPGFCYVVCDLTSSVERRCRTLSLTATSDHLGYFGYNPNYKAYIEVVSFDRLLNSARERNRAFFDKLGLPA